MVTSEPSAIDPLSFEDADDLDVLVYARIFLRRWWVFALAVLLSMSAAYYVNESRGDVYQATAKILVRGGQSPGQSTVGDIQSSQQLAENLTDLLGTRPILRLVSNVAGLAESEDVSGMLTITSTRSLLEVTATDPDPQFAADLANLAAGVFVDEFARQELTALAELRAALVFYNVGESIEMISAQVASLRTLSVAEEALPPISPESNLMLYLLLGLALGVVSGGLWVLLLEYREDGIRSPELLLRLTKTPLLGTVSYRSGTSMIAPLVLDRGLSEQFSFIHTSLDFSSVGLQNTRTLLITSAGAGEGKSTVAAGLALSIAKHGKPTILLDADLRRPSLASRFDLHEPQGLTELLLGRAEPADVMSRVGDENLFVIAAGSIPPDPTVLLRSSRFAEVLKSLESLSALVIIDSPPLLPVTDAMLISDTADATALVVDVRKTRRSAVRQASAMLRRGNANVLGVIQNKSKAQNSNYYYYGSYSQHTPAHGLPVRIIKRLAPRRLFAKQ